MKLRIKGKKIELLMLLKGASKVVLFVILTAIPSIAFSSSRVNDERFLGLKNTLLSDNSDALKVIALLALQESDYDSNSINTLLMSLVSNERSPEIRKGAAIILRNRNSGSFAVAMFLMEHLVREQDLSVTGSIIRTVAKYNCFEVYRAIRGLAYSSNSIDVKREAVYTLIDMFNMGVDEIRNLADHSVEPFRSELISLEKMFMGRKIDRGIITDCQVVSDNQTITNLQTCDNTEADMEIAGTHTYVRNGSPMNKVDIVVVGDGYTIGEIPRFREDVVDLKNALFDHEPFKSRFNEFNFHCVDVVSVESGVDRPLENICRNNALGVFYNGGTQMLISRKDHVRQAARRIGVNADLIVVIANDSKTGGTGFLYPVFNNGSNLKNTGVHEIGHSFAVLGDEYVQNSLTYEGFEPVWPNLTVHTDPSRSKWKDLLGTDPFTGATVDFFEGGAGEFKYGIWRPTKNECKMNVSGYSHFCIVCRRAINRMIDLRK
ncbi:MAG: hypothetical protein HY606_04375 [Planctomycetes bacterium]|nr:hypothetical protein [Planctomycetota bacterium]